MEVKRGGGGEINAGGRGRSGGHVIHDNGVERVLSQSSFAENYKIRKKVQKILKNVQRKLGFSRLSWVTMDLWFFRVTNYNELKVYYLV